MVNIISISKVTLILLLISVIIGIALSYLFGIMIPMQDYNLRLGHIWKRINSDRTPSIIIFWNFVSNMSVPCGLFSLVDKDLNLFDGLLILELIYALLYFLYIKVSNHSHLRSYIISGIIITLILFILFCFNGY